jgi:hypothetical protein
MTLRQGIDRLESDVKATRRDVEKSSAAVRGAKVSRTIENSRKRFDPVRVIEAAPITAASVALIAGILFGVTRRPTRDMLDSAARTFVISAVISAFSMLRGR